MFAAGCGQVSTGAFGFGANSLQSNSPRASARSTSTAVRASSGDTSPQTPVLDDQQDPEGMPAR